MLPEKERVKKKKKVSEPRALRLEDSPERPDGALEPPGRGVGLHARAEDVEGLHADRDHGTGDAAWFVFFFLGREGGKEGGGLVEEKGARWRRVGALPRVRWAKKLLLDSLIVSISPILTRRTHLTRRSRGARRAWREEAPWPLRQCRVGTKKRGEKKHPLSIRVKRGEK